MPNDAPVTLAAVVGAHGVAGEVRLKVFADSLAAFTAFNDVKLTLKSLRPTPQGAIARFAEVPDRNAAEALRGTALTVPRAALPALGEGEYYHADLIGLTAVSEAGDTLGSIVAVENFGAGDVIEIVRPDGKTFMIPMRCPNGMLSGWSSPQRLLAPDRRLFVERIADRGRRDAGLAHSVADLVEPFHDVSRREQAGYRRALVRVDLETAVVARPRACGDR